MRTRRPIKTNSSRTPAADHLLRILISDIERDVEVVARELNLSSPMVERCRRVLDRLQAAQKILGMAEADDGGPQGRAVAGLREAMEFLAREWPAEYPAHAAEWMLLGSLASDWSGQKNKPASSMHSVQALAADCQQRSDIDL